eukprot:2280528-Alexandrium_andersonii.AAC.1
MVQEPPGTNCGPSTAGRRRSFRPCTLSDRVSTYRRREATRNAERPRRTSAAWSISGGHRRAAHAI